MFKLLEHLHPRGMNELADALPWRMPHPDGIIGLNHGGFLVSYEYVGPNPQAVNDDELDSLDDAVGDAVARLGEGWSVFANIIRKPATDYPVGDCFPPGVARVMNEERRTHYRSYGTHYESRQVISLCYHPQSLLKKATNLWFFAATGIDSRASSAEQALAAFRAGIADFERTFGSALRLRRLGMRAALDDQGHAVAFDDHLSFLYECLRGIRQPMRTAPTGYSIARYLGVHELVADWAPTIDEDALIVVEMSRPPQRRTYTAILQRLHDLGIDFRASLRVVTMGRAESRTQAVRKRAEWGHKVFGFGNFMGGGKAMNARPDRLAGEMEADADTAILRFDRGEVTFVHVTFSIVLSSEDRARGEQAAADLVSTMRDLGFVARVARVGAGRAFFATLPGEVYAGVNHHMLTNRNAANMVPLTSVWSGVDAHPSPLYPTGAGQLIYATTTGGAPIRLPLHWDSAGHTLIVGGAGGGKSTLLKHMLWRHLQYADAYGTVLDRDRAMSVLARALQLEGIASYYDFEDPKRIGLCPFAHIHESPTEQEYAVSFVEQLLHHNGIEPNIDLRRELQRGVALLAGQRYRNLEALSTVVPSKEVWNVVDYYLRSPLGSVLNANSDSVDARPYQIFETGALMSASDPIRLPILRHIFHLAERRTRQRRPGLFIGDEARAFLRDPYVAEIILDILLRWRKLNVAGIFAVQEPSHILESGEIGEALLQECKTMFFTGDSSVLKEGVAANFRALGLQAGEEELVANLKQAHGYLYTSPLGRAPFSLEMGPVEQAFLACDEGEARRAVEALIAEHPRDWPSHHLRARGLSDWADYYRSVVERPGKATVKEIAA